MTNVLATHYAGKRVLLTGHTGFKGSWMSVWLAAMGAQVFGYALAPETDPALFDLADIASLVDHRIGDIRDFAALSARVEEVMPDIVMHMAAQPIVRESYRTPLATLDTNVMGTAHVLEAVRAAGRRCAIVVVTSDKCYENNEWIWGYRENDAMGGHDPYSMSKGAAELVVSSWRRSYFGQPDGPIQLASARAGNVIGGGDWAADRILTDCVRSLIEEQPIKLRNPLATRPWQHVLEPLSGYLWLGARLMATNGNKVAEGWNFGPLADSVRPVSNLTDLIIQAWGSGSWAALGDPAGVKEAFSLSLNCDKAAHLLHWFPTWSLEQCIERTIEWYKAWHLRSADLLDLTRRQIATYERDAIGQRSHWAMPA
jgi:CDP-glucose 4,6-dehydratase